MIDASLQPSREVPGANILVAMLVDVAASSREGSAKTNHVGMLREHARMSRPLVGAALFDSLPSADKPSVLSRVSNADARIASFRRFAKHGVLRGVVAE